MRFLPRVRVQLPVSPRQPDEKGLLAWVQRELHPLLQQFRRVLNWCAEYCGLIGVTISDTPGTLETKALQGSGITITKTGAAGTILVPGHQALVFSADVDTIVQTIINNPTTVQIITNTITVVQQTPLVIESTLYPAKVNDPKLRTPVRALAAFGAGYGLPILVEFNPTGALYTWQRANTNPVLAYIPAGNVPLAVGDRFVVANTETLGTGQSLYSGIYELLTQGDGASVYAVIRRTSDSNTPALLCTGMAVQITGVGMGGEGDYFKLTAGVTTVDVDAPTWTLGSYSPTEAFELLTGPQLSSEGANNVDTLTISATGIAGIDLTQPFATSFETIVGTPGIASFPAALTTFDVESITLSGCTGTAVLQAGLYINGVTLIVLGTSQPLPNDTTTNFSFQAAPAAPVSMSPTDRISVVYFLKYTSSLPVSVLLTYSSPSRRTRITVPFQMALTGGSTGRHQDLSGRELLNQHPTSASTPVVNTITEVSPVGWFTLGTAAFDLKLAHVDHVRLIPAGTDIYGFDKLWIDGAAIPDLKPIYVFLGTPTPSAPIVLHNGATPPGGSTFLPLSLPWNYGDSLDMDLLHPTALEFRLDLTDNVWRLQSLVSYE